MAPLRHALASTLTKVGRAKINAPSISPPMRCHSVASSNCEPDDAVEHASFSMNHMNAVVRVYDGAGTPTSIRC
jgi:hypothetical protein